MRGALPTAYYFGGPRPYMPLAATPETVPCFAASAICFMAARDAGDGPRWCRGGPRRGLNGSGDRPPPGP